MKELPSPAFARRQRQARRGLLWGAVLFGLGQVGLLLVQDYHPPLRDPEYGRRLVRLRQRLAERPGAPLVLFMGSSRATIAFQPHVLDGWRTADGRQPVLFNMAAPGPGPLRALLHLHRLLADGVRPDHLVVEFWAPFADQQIADTEPSLLPASRQRWQDVRLLANYTGRPGRLLRGWLWARLCPWHSSRIALLSQCAAGWLPQEVYRQGQHAWQEIDGHGAVASFVAVPEEMARRQTEFDRTFYKPLLERFRPAPLANRALNDLLGLCRREGIAVTLVYLPESGTLRGWYPPALRRGLDVYLAGLARRRGVGLVDARAWMADEHYLDTHHLLAAGTVAFTERFGREVLGLRP